MWHKLKPYVVEYLIAAAISWLAASLLFAPIWLGDSFVYAGDFSGSDLLDMNLPFRYLAVQSIKEGSLPLWRPEIGCGFPLLAEGQAGVFYPTTLPLFLLFSVPWASNLSIISALATAAWGGYVLGRVHGFSKAASAFTGCTVAFSPILVFRLKHLNMLQVAAWLPLSLAAIRIIVNSAANLVSVKSIKSDITPASIPLIKPASQLRLSLLTLTVCWLLQILAGHPHVTYICGLSCLIYAAILLIRPLLNPGHRRRLLTYVCLSLISCALLSLLLGTCQLLPTYELTQLSIRSAPKTWQSLSDYPFSKRHFWLFINPFHYENPAGINYQKDFEDLTNNGVFWEAMPYLGLLPLLLWPYALVKRDKLPAEVGPLPELVATSLVFLLLALGTQGKLYWLPWKLCPGFNLFRFPARFLIPFGVMASLWAGLGADALLNELSLRWPKKARLWAGSLLPFVAFANFYWSTNAYATYLPSDIFARPTAADMVADSSRLSTFNMQSCWAFFVRDYGWQNTRNQLVDMFHCLMSDSSAFWGIAQDTNRSVFEGGLGLKYYVDLQYALKLYVSPLASNSSSTPVTILSNEAVTLYKMQNVSHILDLYQVAHKDGTSFPIVGETYMDNLRSTLHLYKIADPQPRAYLVPHFVTAQLPSNPVDFLKAHSQHIDRGDTCVIHDLTDTPASHSGQAPTALSSPPGNSIDSLEKDEYCHILQNKSLNLDMEVNVSKVRVLLFTENHYPSWQAYIDGQPVDIYRTNYSFMSCIVPPGKHQIHFEFKSNSIKLGLCLTALATFIFSILTFFSLQAALHGR